MIETIYPKNLKTLFTNRKYELSLLGYLTEQLKLGSPRNYSFFGTRRIGKSILVKEFIDQLKNSKVAPVYINLESIASNPENFVKKFIGLICYWLKEKGRSPQDDYLNFHILKKKMSANKNITEKLIDIDAAVDQKIIDRNYLLHQAFSFPQFIAKTYNKKLLVFLDEFQDIRGLAKFKNCSNILSVFRQYLESDNVSFVLLGSIVSAMTELLSSHKSPLFGQITQHTLANFSKDDSLVLIKKILPAPVDLETCLQIYHYTEGQPFYITVLSNRLRTSAVLFDKEINQETVKQAVVIETLSKEGNLYNHFKYLYDLSIEKSRFSSVLKTALNILAHTQGLTQTQIAKKMNTTQGAVRTYLRELIECEFLFKKNHQYFFTDQLFRYWIFYQEQDVEIRGWPSKKSLRDLIKQLQEKFNRVSAELGLVKEAEIRELLGKMQGRSFQGKLFGLKNQEIKIPMFKSIEKYQDKTIEIDILAKNKQIWAIEIKWQNQVIDKEELQKFKNKIKARKYWFISKSGFSGQALRYAKRVKMLVSDQQDLEEIAGQV